MRVVFITGTNTDVGKTVATASAIAATHKAHPGLRIGVIKPAQTGVPAIAAQDLGSWDSGDKGDLAVIKKLIPATPFSLFEFVRYPEPLAPDLAGRRAGMTLYGAADFAAAIAVASKDLDLLFVEGAGGILVGLGQADTGEPVTLVDIAQRVAAQNPHLEVSTMVVSQPDLGMLNHCLLTVREVERTGLIVSGIVFGTWPAQPDLAMRLNQDEVTRVTGVPVIAQLPAGVGTVQESGSSGETIIEACSPKWWKQLPWLT